MNTIQESARVWLAGQTMFEDSPMVEASRLVVALAGRIDELETTLREISLFCADAQANRRSKRRKALGEARDG